MAEGFLTDLWTAQVFFRYCRMYKIEDKETKKQLWGRLAKKKKAQYIRDIDPYMKDKSIMILKHKKKKA